MDQSKQTTMNVSLPEALKAFVDDEVKAGGYTGASEFVRELIRGAKDRREAEKVTGQLTRRLGSADADAVREAIREVRALRQRLVGRLSQEEIADFISEGRQ